MVLLENSAIFFSNNRNVAWNVLVEEELGKSSIVGKGRDHKKKQVANGAGGSGSGGDRTYGSEGLGSNGEGGGEQPPLPPHQINEILQLHNADHPGIQLVCTQLTGVNFLNWSRAIKRALGAKSKLEILDGTLPEPHFTNKYYR